MNLFKISNTLLASESPLKPSMKPLAMVPYFCQEPLTKRPCSMSRQCPVSSCSSNTLRGVTHLVDVTVAFMEDQEAVPALAVLLPVGEVAGHLKRDLSVCTLSRIELLELLQFARGDEEEIFDVVYNDNLEACLQGGLRDLLLLVLVKAS